MYTVYCKQRNVNNVILTTYLHNVNNVLQALFAESRWEELVLEFRTSNYELHHLHADSLLSTVLQSGLSAIKTHQCYRYITQSPSPL